jgi:hypothetical protein
MELTLLDGVALHGTLRDPNGHPIPDAWVNVTAAGSTKDEASGRDRGTSFLSMPCDPDGSYRSLPLPYRVFTFEFGAPGFSVQWKTGPRGVREVVVPPGVREHEEDAVLDPAPRLRGTIVRLDGSPAHLAAAKRSLSVNGSIRSPENVSTPVAFGFWGTIEKDDDRYEIASPSGRPEYVSVWSNDVLLGWSKVPPEGDGPEIRIDLARLDAPRVSGSIALVVVESGSGRPIPDYTVSANFDQPFSTSIVRAADVTRAVHDEAGIASFDGMEPGDYEIGVRAKGFASRCVTVEARAESPATPFRVELGRAQSSIAGRVVGSSGTPIAGALLCLRSVDGGVALAPPECSTTSNAEGAFRFDGLPEVECFVVAEQHDLAPAAVRVRAGETNAVVTLVPGVVVDFELTGDESVTQDVSWKRVLDEHGIPVVDEHRPGRMLLRMGAHASQRLVEGDYTVEFASPKWRSEAVRFRATAGAKVAVPRPARTRIRGASPPADPPGK